MTIADKLTTLAAKLPTVQDRLDTEEATKNALVMPFIAALGYDVFDPTEVIPEYIADVGIKKGEKVDYAICKDGNIVMIFEAKRVSENLGQTHASQLFRYFSVSDVRIGVLTNGIEYRFYSDIDEPNKMDADPFLVIDLNDLREEHFAVLEKLSNAGFDLEAVMAGASDLKDLATIRAALEQQFVEADDGFARWLFDKTNHDYSFTKTVRARFGELALKGLHGVVSERVNKRLRSAVGLERSTPPTSEAPPAPDVAPPSDTERKIITTDEEIEGFHIVRAIACRVVDVERVAARDTQAYFGVLLDDNNRKPICRLQFNAASKKYLVLFDAEKNPTRHLIDRPTDIYKFADEICAAATRYMTTADEE